MVDPWLSFLILSVLLCSCSSRTCSSLCSQRRRPFCCSARSSCSCSFWDEKAEGENQVRGRQNLRHNKDRIRTWSVSNMSKCTVIKPLTLYIWWPVPTFMWSWARLRRLRVVFLIESDDRGTCFLSCSRQYLSWARLQSTTSNNWCC